MFKKGRLNVHKKVSLDVEKKEIWMLTKKSGLDGCSRRSVI